MPATDSADVMLMAPPPVGWPGLCAVFPVKLLSVTVRLPQTPIAPASAAVLPEKTLLLITTDPPPKIAPPPQENPSLPENVLLVMVKAPDGL